MTKAHDTPAVRYHRFWPDGEPPRRADKSALGSLPTRAYQYCEAVRVGSGAGHYLFPPSDFFLMWDGHRPAVSPDGENWTAIEDTVTHMADPEHWESIAPDDLKWACPPFITALQEPGFIQINLGLIPSANPGWGLLMMPPANFPLPYPMGALVGVIDVNVYRGPLFANFRITKTDEPFKVYGDRPLAQAVPVRIAGMTDAVFDDFSHGPMTDEVWEAYRAKVAQPRENPKRKFGTYAVEARKEAAHAG